MTEQEKEIWMTVFMARVVQGDEGPTTYKMRAEAASMSAHAAIEECRKAGITDGPK